MIASIRRSMVAALCGALLLPQTLWAAPPAAPGPITDISLQTGGRLVGCLVDAQGIGLADRPLVVLQRGTMVAQTRTTAAGRFEIAGLRGGVYEVAHERAGGVVRLWTADAAPPAAQPMVLLVEPDELATVRGQSPVAYVNPMAIPKFIWIGAIGAAIAYGIVELSDAS